MWFRGKPRNRRLGREHVLDVKLRSSKVRAARARMAAVGLGSFFAVVLGAYLLWCAGEWALNEFVYQNPAFGIQEIDIATDGVLSPEQLRRWIGVKPNDNLLALDLIRVERDLKLVPVVQSVSIERIPPRTLRIRVVEREPLAEIRVPRPRSGGGIEMASYLLDTEGYVLAPLQPSQRSPSAPPPPELPVVSGVNANELLPGRRLQATQTDAVLQLLLAFERSPMSGLVDLKKIDLGLPDVLVVTTGQESVITLGLMDLEQQLRRWREVYDASQKLGKVIASLDLAVSNNVPVTWLEASTTPPVSPKLSKPPQNKKKHV
jgi:cell division septal protein FtsQ